MTDGLMSETGRNGNAQGKPRSPSAALQPAEAPPPPKRSRQARNNLVVIFNSMITLVMLVAIAGFAFAHFGRLRFEEPGPLQVSRTVVVKEGSSLSRIAEQLQAAGIIDSSLMFEMGVRAYKAGGNLKAGEYAFAPSMSMYEVMDTLRSGKGIIHKISFPEGLTTYQIFERLKANEVLVGDLPAELPPEGSLMPDTYPFQRGTSRMEIVEQMRRQHERFLKQIWERRVPDLPISTPQELVTLASIVEKETGKPEERPRVGIFGGQGRPADRPIYRSDIDTPTPYNTYQIDGLPPGPIANPGRASLEAVSNPSRTKDLFFVADGTGGHVFAETLDQHNDNVKRWRAIEQRLREEQAKRQAEAEKAAKEAAANEAGETGKTAQ